MTAPRALTDLVFDPTLRLVDRWRELPRAVQPQVIGILAWSNGATVNKSQAAIPNDLSVTRRGKAFPTGQGRAGHL